MRSWYAGFRALGNSSACTMRPTRISTLAKSSYEIEGMGESSTRARMLQHAIVFVAIARRPPGCIPAFDSGVRNLRTLEDRLCARAKRGSHSRSRSPSRLAPPAISTSCSMDSRVGGAVEAEEAGAVAEAVLA